MVRIVLLAGVLLVAACGGGGDPGTGIQPQDPQLVGAGAGLYALNCAVCHGDDLRGTPTGPSLLSVVYEPGHHGDGAFQLAVLQGSRAHHWQFGDMPPVPGLTVGDVEAIVAFVRERQRIEGFEPYPP
jgi:mono/diheme cytochrome c family protein